MLQKRKDEDSTVDTEQERSKEFKGIEYATRYTSLNSVQVDIKVQPAYLLC